LVGIVNGIGYLRINITVFASVELLVAIAEVNVVQPTFNHSHTECFRAFMLTVSAIHLNFVLHSLRDAILNKSCYVRKINALLSILSCE